jgi:hypothetical protein
MPGVHVMYHKRFRLILRRKALRKFENLPLEKKALIESIKTRTKKENLTNITRTTAYLDFFLRNPEVHWAFLAHMVSRNAGWNMTDLKGDLLPRLLTEIEQNHLFDFLERANWLIFQDAYPQLLLYEESKKRNEDLFDLLSYFSVSKFMKLAWKQFWNNHNSKYLSISLIINEQFYIEERVIQNKHYQTNVLQSFEFKMQEILEMNHVLLPYHSEAKTKITGLKVHHFTSVDERIRVGRILYDLIFNEQKVLTSLKDWTLQQSHTGSRKDYWPHLFSEIQDSWPSKPFEIKAVNCQLVQVNQKLYSPKLEHVWDFVDHQPPEEQDWYTNNKSTKKYYFDIIKNPTESLLDSYCRSLDLIQLAVVAKKMLVPWRKSE